MLAYIFSTLILAQLSSAQSFGGSGHRVDTKDDSAENLFQSFLREAIVSSSGKGRPLFDVVRLPFPLTTVASPTLQDALKDEFRKKAVVACDMPEP